MKNLLVRVGSLFVIACGTLFLLVASANAQGDVVDLYKTQCASCHGEDGKANNPVGQALKTRDFTSEDVQKETDAEMIDITTNGKNLMPAYKDKLTADQITQLVAYIRATFIKAGAPSAYSSAPPSISPSTTTPTPGLKMDSKVPTHPAVR